MLQRYKKSVNCIDQNGVIQKEFSLTEVKRNRFSVIVTTNCHLHGLPIYVDIKWE